MGVWRAPSTDWGPGLGSNCSLLQETTWTPGSPDPPTQAPHVLPPEACHILPDCSVEGQMLSHENKIQYSNLHCA